MGDPLSCFPASQDLNFHIDKYINRFVPRSQVYRLPKPISRFLGHREKPGPDVGNILIAAYSFVGAFCGLALVGAVLRYGPAVQIHNPPVIFASLGAAAILEYNTITSPLAQPRNAVLGHTIAAIVGVGVSKLFQMHPDFANLQWVVGAISCGMASSVMGLTNTVHPPGGATAVLAVVDTGVLQLGWLFVPLMLMASVLMLVVALLINNIQRQFPTCWWTPFEVRRPEIVSKDIESVSASSSSGCDTLKHPLNYSLHGDAHGVIVLGPNGVLLPDWCLLTTEELMVVRRLVKRLKDGGFELGTKDTEVKKVEYSGKKEYIAM